MNSPSKSYIIWFSQRTGSTLLCKALEATNVAGKPGEWLLAADMPDLLEGHQVDTSEALRQKLWSLASTPNGVCGLKFSPYEPYHTQLLDLFRQLPDASGAGTNRADVWSNVMPNCRHIFLTRRNKVRLAVSWWKAICSQEWHREVDGPALDQGDHSAYNYEAIDHLLCEATLREAAIQELFSEGDIVPHTIVYEDFIADFEGTIRDTLDFLEVTLPERITIEPPFFTKLADDVSEAWVQRFRRERQQGWTNIAW
jgi:LPS sulfotransferase NodH